MTSAASAARPASDRALRTILHVDMDAFYVSVELRRRPELRGQPVVVGGTGPRGVVAAASYEARRYGVHSAMPGSTARRLCPHAVFLSGDHRLYAEVSRSVHEIFHEATPIVEPLALDEAFLDVTGALRLLGDGVAIAQQIRTRVAQSLDLTCSVGVAPNKFLAKLASVAAKPRATPDGVLPGPGVFEVRRGRELQFLHPLAVQRLWGVGPATLEKLQRLGVSTVGDLFRLGEQTLVAALGRSTGRHLYALSQAIDDRPVEVDRAMKSIGHEETFARDLHEQGELRTELVRLSDAVAARLRHSDVGARTLTLKVRFAGFETITRSTTLPSPVATASAILDAVGPLLNAIDPTPGVRLIGVHASNFAAPVQQLSMDALLAGGEPADWTEASAAIDAIRERFGDTAIGPASTVSAQGMRLVRKGHSSGGRITTARGLNDAAHHGPHALSEPVERAKLSTASHLWVGPSRRTLMPLSEEEQRILRQIEEQLQADPTFALKVNQRSHPGNSRHRLLWSVVGLVAGLALAIAALQVSALLAFAGFVAMLVAGVFLERELSARGRDQLSRIPDELRRRAGRSSGQPENQ